MERFQHALWGVRRRRLLVETSGFVRRSRSYAIWVCLVTCYLISVVPLSRQV